MSSAVCSKNKPYFWHVASHAFQSWTQAMFSVTHKNVTILGPPVSCLCLHLKPLHAHSILAHKGENGRLVLVCGSRINHWLLQHNYNKPQFNSPCSTSAATGSKDRHGLLSPSPSSFSVFLWIKRRNMGQDHQFILFPAPFPIPQCSEYPQHALEATLKIILHFTYSMQRLSCVGSSVMHFPLAESIKEV